MRYKNNLVLIHLNLHKIGFRFNDFIYGVISLLKLIVITYL